MDAGTLFWILVIGGGVIAMFFMHRGGHANGGLGSGSGCGGHGHDHGRTPADETRESRKDDTKPFGKAGAHDHDHEPAAAGGKHRGC